MVRFVIGQAVYYRLIAMTTSRTGLPDTRSSAPTVAGGGGGGGGKIFFFVSNLFGEGVGGPQFALLL
jgi:hypothetical protein